MKRAILLDTATHRVTSYGNGTAYAVVRKATGEGFVVQGDEALEFYSSVFDQDIMNIADAIETLYGSLFQEADHD